MNEGGIYRAGGAAPGGLPLPRMRLLRCVVTLFAAAGVATLLGPLLVGLVGHSRWFPHFREAMVAGGSPMWLVLFLDVVAPLAIAALGMLVVRGKRVPAGLLYAIAALPFLMGLGSARLSTRGVVAAVAKGRVTPERVTRLVSQGLAEAMQLEIFGGFVSFGAALVVALAALGAVSTIDVTLASRADAKPR